MKKNVLIFILLSVVASGVNYIAYPILSRLLPSSQYTDITVALSLLTQISTFLSSIVAITIGISKEHDAKTAKKEIDNLQAILLRAFSVVSLTFLVISPILLPLISTPVQYAIPISIMMLASIPIAIISGYLNGKNMLIKVGIVAAISASMQLLLGISSAVATNQGVITMLCMGAAQIVTIILLYRLYRKDGLPSITATLAKPVINSPYVKRLILYTLFASIAIMAVNVLQIADLLIIERLSSVDVKFYTDIYVISRVVFFAGIIFVWPFLGEISFDDATHNKRILLRLLAVFGAISLGAIAVLYVAGEQIVNLLFSAAYPYEKVLAIGALSILYKLFLLVITAVCLYFIVLRRRAALYISLFASLVIIAVSVFIEKSSTINEALLILDGVTGVIAIAAILAALSISPRAAPVTKL